MSWYHSICRKLENFAKVLNYLMALIIGIQLIFSAISAIQRIIDGIWCLLYDNEIQLLPERNSNHVAYQRKLQYKRQGIELAAQEGVNSVDSRLAHSTYYTFIMNFLM